ncbi:cation-translocating P-type ATPase [Faunimonas sp. B44]|uniref:cation-translocating P-type ATPase n=1 Tax=Faunimonas sp. B44 TaxID=3461493 RepID=UPI004044F139
MDSSVAVRHHVPGRTRLDLACWPAAGDLAAILSGLAGRGWTVASANRHTKSILLKHGGDVPPEAVAEHVAGLLRQPPRAGGREAGAGGGPIPGGGEAELRQIAAASRADVLARLGSSQDGLAADEASRLLGVHGPNAVPARPGRSQRAMLAEQLTTLPVALLAGSAVLSLATGGLVDAVVTIGVVVVNAAIGFSSENATERLIRRLSQPVDHLAAVVRDGAQLTIPARDVVPGDVVLLAPSAVVPADARLIEASDLTIDESILTGESLPAEKSAGGIRRPFSSVAERANIVHAGTVVTGGGGRAVVFRTGAGTEMARTRDLIGSTRRQRPVIEDKLAALATRLAIGCVAISGVVFAIGYMRGEPLVGLAKSAVALAVSAIPEGLPAVATTALALGARSMEGEGAFVRSLPAIEALGSIDTICLDKTGTLTENRMAVVAVHLGAEPRAILEGSPRTASDDPDLRALGESIALCNEARLGAGTGSATELALLGFAASVGIDPDALQARYPIAAIRNRNQTRHFMATEHRSDDASWVIVKGAPEEVLAVASDEAFAGAVAPLSQERRAAIVEANQALAGKGLRVLGVARRVGSLEEGEIGGMTWLGLVALADPVRLEAREAVELLHRAGVRTIMITGDQAATALNVAETLFLSRTGIIPVVEGWRIADLSEAELGELALKTSVFARVGPAEKLRIVKALESAGRRVAMIGDGVNDGPALRAASVGVAMGKNGTDVAREVADIVIADDDLRELARAIARGRATNDNVKSSLGYFLSTNLSEVLVMLFESLHGRGELETPMELFWLNLVTDILPALGLALAEPRGDVMARPPQPADAPLFERDEIARLGLDGGGIAAAALLAHFLTLSRAGLGPRTRSMTFATLALAQIAHAWALRDRSPGAGEALAISERRLEGFLAAAAALLALPFLAPPLRRLLGIAPLSTADVLTAGAFAGGSLALAEGRRVVSAAGARRGSPRSSPPARTG